MCQTRGYSRIFTASFHCIRAGGRGRIRLYETGLMVKGAIASLDLILRLGNGAILTWDRKGTMSLVR